MWRKIKNYYTFKYHRILFFKLHIVRCFSTPALHFWCPYLDVGDVVRRSLYHLAHGYLLHLHWSDLQRCLLQDGEHLWEPLDIWVHESNVVWLGRGQRHGEGVAARPHDSIRSEPLLVRHGSCLAGNYVFTNLTASESAGKNAVF